jgi:hypothetical protein
LHVSIIVSIKKNVKHGSAAWAFSLAIFCAVLYVDVHRVSTGVKVVGIIEEGLCKRDWRVHGLMLYW